jgi:hypothetical protein|nr:MAG TPA: hypothetical protein [Bacteriophage sp.]
MTRLELLKQSIQEYSEEHNTKILEDLDVNNIGQTLICPDAVIRDLYIDECDCNMCGTCINCWNKEVENEVTCNVELAIEELIKWRGIL